MSHLQLEEDVVSFSNNFFLLKLFECAYGLKISKSKSGLAGINVDSRGLSPFALLAGCQIFGMAPCLLRGCLRWELAAPSEIQG